jgi:hypothetical protein
MINKDHIQTFLSRIILLKLGVSSLTSLTRKAAQKPTISADAFDRLDAFNSRLAAEKAQPVGKPGESQPQEAGLYTMSPSTLCDLDDHMIFDQYTGSFPTYFDST